MLVFIWGDDEYTVYRARGPTLVRQNGLEMVFIGLSMGSLAKCEGLKGRSSKKIFACL